MQVQLKPLAQWCNAEYIEQKVEKIIGDQNKIQLSDGTLLDFDVLIINVGSRTSGTEQVPGVYEHSLSTRPINDMLGKIIAKENYLKEKGITPTVVICGAGAAGTELAFGFKHRWSKLF